MPSPAALIDGSESPHSDQTDFVPITEAIDAPDSLAHRLVRSILLENALGSGRTVASSEVEMAAHLAAMLAIARPQQRKQWLDDLFYRRSIARATARAILPTDALAADTKLAITTIVFAEQNRRDGVIWEGRVGRRQAGIGRRAGFKRSLKEASAGVALYLALAAGDVDNSDGGPSR